MIRATFRPGTPDDDDLVYGAWMRKALALMKSPHAIPTTLWYGQEGMRGRIAALAGNVTIAEHNGAVLGFAVSVADSNTLHWVHVKPEFRGFKISMMLIVGTGIRDETALDDERPLGCAFSSSFMDAIRKHFNQQTYYNPFAL